MKRIVFLIPLALCGCSQTREERREAVKNYVKKIREAPVSDQPLLQDFVDDRIDKQNRQAGDIH